MADLTGVVRVGLVGDGTRQSLTISNVSGCHKHLYIKDAQNVQFLTYIDLTFITMIFCRYDCI